MWLSFRITVCSVLYLSSYWVRVNANTCITTLNEDKYFSWKHIVEYLKSNIYPTHFRLFHIFHRKYRYYTLILGRIDNQYVNYPVFFYSYHHHLGAMPHQKYFVVLIKVWLFVPVLLRVLYDFNGWIPEYVKFDMRTKFQLLANGL